MNAVSGSILLLLLLVVMLGRRRWALLAIVSGLFFLTQGHSVTLVGLSLFPDRLLGACALLRVSVRRELGLSRMGSVDWLVLAAYTYASMIWILRSSAIAPAQVGAAVDPAFNYLALRALVRDGDDVRWLLRRLALLLVPYAVLVSLERATGMTSFRIVGATWEFAFRNGKARCQGSFRHAVLLGSVAASFLPLYAAELANRASRVLSVLGASMCLGLVVFANSGGPLTSTVAAAAAWLLWPARRRMATVRLLAVVVLLLLVAFMEAPIWYLPFKISSLVGGAGWHRAVLLERAWQHLGDWWLVGMDIRHTASWLPYWSDATGGADITNQFLVIGLQGGLPALFLFTGVLVVAFRKLGQALAVLRERSGDTAADQKLLWGLGATLFVHAVSWFGVSYFDQSSVVWLFHLAAVAAVTSTILETGLVDGRRGRSVARRPLPPTVRRPIVGPLDAACR